MITNISVVSPSAVHISVGQYNHGAQRLELWVYATRYIVEDGVKFANVADFDLSPFKQAKKVVLVDLDWDYRYEMTYAQFKKIPIKDGFRKVNISNLKAI
jgi:hypothetical protein